MHVWNEVVEGHEEEQWRNTRALHVHITRWKETYNVVRAMPRQVIPIFLGIDHCHPLQDKSNHDLSNLQTWPSMTNLPRISISILSRLGYSFRWHPSRLGPTPRQVSLPTLKCQPKEVPDCNSHDPTDTLNQRKPFNSPWITHRSHQSNFVLNQPRA